LAVDKDGKYYCR